MAWRSWKVFAPDHHQKSDQPTPCKIATRGLASGTPVFAGVPRRGTVRYDHV